MARAADHPIGGDRLLLTDGARGRTFRFRAVRDAAIDPRKAGDPRTVGAVLEVQDGAEGGTSGSIALDPARWKALGSRGYLWTDRAQATGVRRVLFRSGRRGGTFLASAGGNAWPY